MKTVLRINVAQRPLILFYLYCVFTKIIFFKTSDVTNPMMIKCKPFANAVADSNSTWGTITWTEPTVIDNADKDIKWTRIGSIAPWDRIKVGTYQVTYTAQDKAGNKARPCKVELSMKGVSKFNMNIDQITLSLRILTENNLIISLVIIILQFIKLNRTSILDIVVVYNKVHVL